MRKRPLVGLWALILLTVACSSASPSGSPVPGASVLPAGAGCPNIDIDGPSGTNVLLTGVWRGDDQGRYDILQRESCIYWLGMSPDIGSGEGDDWTNVFAGTIRSDFTIHGEWGDVPFNPQHEGNDLGNGTLVIRIDFDQSGEVERPVLRVEERTGFFGGSVWVQEESLSPPTDLEGPFGGDEARGCVWVEANGQRVELVGSGVWTYRNPPLSIQDRTGHIAARVGDLIRVHGQLSTVLHSDCTDTGIVVETLEPIP